ncbi:MAG: class I SAM-dependent methyltransferase [Solirubrobacteraceae bacterium]
MPSVPTSPPVAAASLTGPDACPWCGSPAHDAERTGARRVRCRACGVQITWPWPDAAELDDAYATWYRPEGGRFSGPGDAIFALTRGSIALRLDRIAPPGMVVDVGSGDGHLLRALARRGRPVLGLERQADGDADPTRPDVMDAALEDLERPPGGVAAIVLWHVIEHLPEPREAVRQAVRLLADDGVLLIACPNAGSRQAAAFGDAWLAWDQPRHLVHLHPAALRAGLEEEGLRVRTLGHLRAGQSVFCALHGLTGRVPGTGDLYDAVRRPDARQRPLGPLRRAWTVLAATLMLPVAAVAAMAESREGRGASIYVEAALPASSPIPETVR